MFRYPTETKPTCSARRLRFFRDITERTRAQEALQKEHRTLKHLLQSSDHERQTIAYEIHDGLAQYLAGAIMQFEVYRYLMDSKPNEATKAYEGAMTLLHQSHFEARRLIAGVRPPVLDEAGVVEAIAHLINEHNLEKGPQIEFRSQVKFSRLVPILENAIYRICQESLANACQHSQSEKVRVSLVQWNDRIQIDIQDWGLGFNPKKVKGDCYGLAGIRERARLLNGKCRIQSELGKGTRIKVELPLMEREE
jgi:two-component system sensor histidine kinase DegS